jgi:copper/silver efflux system protein
MSGAVERVRAKMMTVAAIMAGMLPIMWSHGTGAEVMQRIAVPMIGDTVSSTLLTLIVIPAIYAVVKGLSLRSPRRRKLIANEVAEAQKDFRISGRGFDHAGGESLVIVRALPRKRMMRLL